MTNQEDEKMNKKNKELINRSVMTSISFVFVQPVRRKLDVGVTSYRKKVMLDDEANTTLTTHDIPA